jgi:hypothetical protein
MKSHHHPRWLELLLVEITLNAKKKKERKKELAGIFLCKLEFKLKTRWVKNGI